MQLLVWQFIAIFSASTAIFAVVVMGLFIFASGPAGRRRF